MSQQCARICCKKQPINLARCALNKASGSVCAMLEVGLRNRFYTGGFSHLCDAHSREYLNLFPCTFACNNDGALGYRYEYDTDNDSIDYLSTKRHQPCKSPERVFSVRPLENDAFQIISMNVLGTSVVERIVNHYLRNTLVSAVVQTKPVNDDCEEISPNKLVSLMGETNATADRYATPCKAKRSDSPSSQICTPPPYSDRLFNSIDIASIRHLFFSQHVSFFIPPPPILISIEGNIGAGKSTILNTLRERRPEWNYIEEPLDTWTSLKNSNGDNLLEVFYKDQRRWSYTFQNCAVLSRFTNIEHSIKTQQLARMNEMPLCDGTSNTNPPISNVFITERSLDTDYHVFAKMLHYDGNMDMLELKLYERWFGLLKETATPLSGLVLVDTPPQLCSERILGRGRQGEAGIPIEYLSSLHAFQEKWVHDCSRTIPTRRVATADEVEQFICTLENSTNEMHVNDDNTSTPPTHPLVC